MLKFLSFCKYISGKNASNTTVLLWKLVSEIFATNAFVSSVVLGLILLHLRSLGLRSSGSCHILCVSWSHQARDAHLPALVVYSHSFFRVHSSPASWAVSALAAASADFFPFLPFLLPFCSFGHLVSSAQLLYWKILCRKDSLSSLLCWPSQLFVFGFSPLTLLKLILKPISALSEVCLRMHCFFCIIVLRALE